MGSIINEFYVKLWETLFEDFYLLEEGVFFWRVEDISGFPLFYKIQSFFNVQQLSFIVSRHV